MARSRIVPHVVQGQRFRFPIYDKSEKLGAFRIQHLWMKISGLYRPTTKRGNYAMQLIECYWALCLEAQRRGEPEHPHDSGNYLLAGLLPQTFLKLEATVIR
jgi:hypothetical protein